MTNLSSNKIYHIINGPKEDEILHGHVIDFRLKKCPEEHFPVRVVEIQGREPFYIKGILSIGDEIMDCEVIYNPNMLKDDDSVCGTMFRVQPHLI